MKTVGAIHDLSCHGKASLAVVIPSLAALGVETSFLPTALLSTQTDGFSDYAYVDLTAMMENVIGHWKRLGLQFDGIYSGFLGSHRQIDTVSHFIDWQREQGANPLVLVDPVLGDQGKPYDPMTFEMIERMRSLVSIAHVTTPNLTEASLLLQEPFDPELPLERAALWARRLGSRGFRSVAITSVMDRNEGIVVAYDAHTDDVRLFRQPYAPVSYPGCGDFFASILCGMQVRGKPFFEAVETASGIVSKAVHLTWESNREVRRGVSLELVMDELVGVFK
jgi:pyridoxine kinase